MGQLVPIRLIRDSEIRGFTVQASALRRKDMQLFSVSCEFAHIGIVEIEFWRAKLI